MPAAAVIPAPIAYINAVAVETLVVGLLDESLGRLRLYLAACPFVQGRLTQVSLTWASYFEKIRVFKAGQCLEYVSME